MRRNAIASTYKKANGSIKKRINEKGKEIVKKSFDNIIDRMDVNAWSNCFITIKDHKENFLNHPKVCLINPAKNELGRISKTFLDNINMKLLETTKINQWKNTVSAIKWFNSLKDKHLMKFVMFDIKDFYPSVTQDLLKTLLVNTYIFRNLILMLYIMQGSHYCLMDPIPGLRNKEVCLMCQWVLTMELQCASLWAHIC